MTAVVWQMGNKLTRFLYCLPFILVITAVTVLSVWHDVSDFAIYRELVKL